MSNKINRNQFLKLLTLLGTATGLSAIFKSRKSLLQTLAQTLDNQSYLPIVLRDRTATPTPTSTHTQTSPTSTSTPTQTPTTPPVTNHRVVHVHNSNATSWNYSTGWYGDYVDQQQVNQMIDLGLTSLTQKPDITAAWDFLLPNYQPGKSIAIKVNFNNSLLCTDTDNIIDALMEPVNSLIRGMLEIGVHASDICVYDAIRDLPVRFQSKCLYPGIRFFDSGCSELATFDSDDPNASVTFQHPNLSSRRITDLIINSTYLINMPILKDHGIAGVTLGFKNHFGTIQTVIKSGEDNLHYYVCPWDVHFNHDYNPLVEIYSNPHILNKTVLIVGDGLYGAYGWYTNGHPPAPWQSFDGNAPNSFFLSLDPVAVDCVMIDILDAEPVAHPRGEGVDDYLKLAAQANMGIYERGDPWGAGYQEIEYIRLEIP